MTEQWRDRNVTPGATVSGNSDAARLQVYLLATGVALAETVFPALDKVTYPNNTTVALWLNFLCDDGAGNPIPFYVNCDLIGGALTVQTPDPLANVTAPLNVNQQCIYVPAGIEWQRKFYQQQAFRAIQLSGADAYLRVEATSELD